MPSAPAAGSHPQSPTAAPASEALPPQPRLSLPRRSGTKSPATATHSLPPRRDRPPEPFAADNLPRRLPPASDAAPAHWHPHQMPAPDLSGTRPSARHPRRDSKPSRRPRPIVPPIAPIIGCATPPPQFPCGPGSTALPAPTQFPATPLHEADRQQVAAGRRSWRFYPMTQLNLFAFGRRLIVKILPFHGLPQRFNAQHHFTVLKQPDGSARLAHDNRQRRCRLADRRSRPMPGPQPLGKRQIGIRGVYKLRRFFNNT